jgi:DNA-binding PadR family transcriptional regulator
MEIQMSNQEDSNIDQILERYLPRTSEEEVQSARDRFLVFLRERHELQEALDNFRTREPVTDSRFISLGYVDQLVLTVAYLLRGEGTSLAVAERVNELTPGKVVDTGAVFIALDRLERGKLLSTRPKEEQSKGFKPHLLFTVTADGERMLRQVRAGARILLEALAPFASAVGNNRDGTA